MIQPDNENVSIPAKLLMITHESIGPKMAGPGIRTWEIACALGKLGVEVTIATPYLGLRSAPNVYLREFSWDDPKPLEDLIEEAHVVFAAGPVITRLIHFIGKPITIPTIVDLYDVAELERIILSSTSIHYYRDVTSVIIDEMFTYLRQGDFFTCATEQQKDFWLGALLAAGRINLHTLEAISDFEKLISVVPFGIPDTPPTTTGPVMKGIIPGIEPGDRVIYWGGGIWDWTDPLSLMEALKIVLASRTDVRVVFGTRHHFDSKIVPEMSIVARLTQYIEREGWLNKYVFFLDWIPYDQRGAYLLEPDLGVSLFANSLENRYAVRSRLFDYFWAGTPCIVSNKDYMARYLSEIGLAWVVEPGDSPGIAALILRLLEHKKEDLIPHELPVHSKRMRWTAIIQPIVEFLKHPRLAPDAAQSRARLHYVIPPARLVGFAGEIQPAC